MLWYNLYGYQAFLNLCTLLRDHDRLAHTRGASIQEQVAKFLHKIGHNVRYRVMSFSFRCSGETVRVHVHRVLDALIELEDTFLKQPDEIQVPLEILNNNRFYLLFFWNLQNFIENDLYAQEVQKRPKRVQSRKKKGIEENTWCKNIKKHHNSTGNKQIKTKESSPC
jgi:hypothetical protein